MLPVADPLITKSSKSSCASCTKAHQGSYSISIPWNMDVMLMEALRLLHGLSTVSNQRFILDQGNCHGWHFSVYIHQNTYFKAVFCNYIADNFHADYKHFTVTLLQSLICDFLNPLAISCEKLSEVLITTSPLSSVGGRSRIAAGLKPNGLQSQEQKKKKIKK